MERGGAATGPRWIHASVLVLLWAGQGHGQSVNGTVREVLPYPDFFIIGAMKCGTTTLHHLLTENPRICAEGEKEKHFFDKVTYITKHEDSREQYLAEFSDCGKQQLTIDSSPDYISTIAVPERMAQSYGPEALSRKRFILILRDPTLRHYSEYQMRLRVCETSYNNDVASKMIKSKSKSKDKEKDADDDEEYRIERFTRNCRAIAHNFVPGMPSSDLQFMTFFQYIHSTHGKQELLRGHYMQHLRAWLKFVRRDQMYIVNFATLLQNTTRVYDDILAFVGVRAGVSEHPIALPEPSYKGRAHAYDPFSYLDCASRERLNTYFAKVNPGLEDFINKGSGARSPFEPDFAPFGTSSCSAGPGKNDADDFMVGTEEDYAEGD